MSQPPHNESTDLLSTVDAEGNRIYLHPSHVDGRFHRRRIAVQAILIAFYLILPWISVGGHQGLLLDIPRREFALFGLYLRAHDVPLLLFPVLGFTLLVALITALWGRVWCGWACPQTVFIEAVFRRIEEWLEGSPLQRRQRDRQPMSPAKLLRRAAKWSLFLSASLLITHSALALFIGRDRLLQVVTHSPRENWQAFLFIAAATTVILVDFGWLREQFCLFACPYGRIQSLFVDRDTRTILYDERRGEPRKGSRDDGAAGDCVNCFRCVQVCPTGIDIRRGSGQLECIGCTACIDACDEVMAKIHKPRGLVRYASEASARGEKSPWWRPRIALYAGILAVLTGLFGWAIAHRTPISVTVLKARGEPFERISDAGGEARIANRFHAEVSNQTLADLEVRFSLPEPDRDSALVMPGNPFTLHPNEIRQIPFAVEYAQTRFRDGTFHTRLTITAHLAEGGEFRSQEEVTLVGPYR
jgi:cytochrome c oxidase accessory protein FixG